MKTPLFILLSITPFLATAQVHFVIKGHVSSIKPPAKIYLAYRKNEGSKQGTIDTSIVKDGNFEFTGDVPDTTVANLVVDYAAEGLKAMMKHGNADSKQIYLVNGMTTIEGDDSLYYAKMSGNKINEDLYKLNTMIEPAMKKWIASNNSPELYEKAMDLRRELSINFIKQNPDSYVSLAMALPNVMGGERDTTFVPYYNSLSANVRSTKKGVEMRGVIESLKAVGPGVMAPDFMQPDTSGKVVTLSSFRGKYVLLDFWASWCGPCREENPNVVKLYKKYKGKNFTILSVSLDRSKDRKEWMNAIHHDHLTWTQVSDLKYWKNGAAELYGIQAIPQNFLIGPDGKIVAVNLFGDDLDKQLAKVLVDKE
jgi:peroxiredoxin